MIGLQARERETYELMWAVEAYSATSPGAQLVSIFLDMTRTTMRGSVLDAGCGAGRGAIALAEAGFEVRCCDLIDGGVGLLPEARRFQFYQLALWDDLKRTVGFADWVYCCDVLEHLPAPFTMLAVVRMLEVARRGVFLSISTMADQFGVWAGKPLHQTVQSFVMWRDQLATIARVVEARDLLMSGVYLLEPR